MNTNQIYNKNIVILIKTISKRHCYITLTNIIFKITKKNNYCL